MNREPLTFADRPRISYKIVSVVLFGVAAYMLSRSFVDRPEQPWVSPALFVFFVICISAMAYEFLWRPSRVTVIDPQSRVIVLEEKALLKARRVVAPITPGTHFETAQRDSDNHLSFEVRFRSAEHGVLRIAECLSKESAEEMARQANAGLFC